MNISLNNQAVLLLTTWLPRAAKRIPVHSHQLNGAVLRSG